MLHTKRRHLVSPVETLAELVEKLRHHSWCTCSAFSWGGLVCRNDSTGPDGAQEFAIFKGDEQIESLTVSWYESDAQLAADLANLAATGTVRPPAPSEGVVVSHSAAELAEALGSKPIKFPSYTFRPHPGRGEYCPACA